MTHRRKKIKTELNQNYHHLSVEKGEHQKLLFGDNRPKTLKEMAETNKETPPIKQYHKISKFDFIQKPEYP